MGNKRDAAIVYEARNTNNGQFYIGVTTLSLIDRKRAHLSEAKRRIYNHKFHAALRSEPDAFEWVVVTSHDNIESAIEAEKTMVRTLRPHYNCVSRAGHGRFGPCANSRSVVCLTDGTSYPSASEAARAYGLPPSSISQVCNRVRHRSTAGGKIFRYEDDSNGGLDQAIEEIAIIRQKAKANNNNLMRPVLCLTDGKKFQSASKAALHYGLSSAAVSAVCTKLYQHTKGLRFIYCGMPTLPKATKAVGEFPPLFKLLDGEAWVRLKGLEERYAISNYGRVCSLDRVVPHARSGPIRRKGVMLAMSIDKNGYFGVGLRFGSCSSLRVYKVHALVAQNFIGDRTEGLLVLHRDGNKHNNRHDNLYYGTAKQNSDDAVTHGTKARGARQGNAKLSEIDVRKMHALKASHSQRSIGKMFGVRQATVQRILTGQSWAHIKVNDNGL